MLFTFMDLEPRRKAEDALRQTEERFSKAFRLAPIPMTVSPLEGFLLLDVNDAFVATTGYAAEEVVARNAGELNLWVDPKANDRFVALLESNSTVHNHEIQLRTRDGTVLDCLVSAETATIHGRRCVLGVLQDITERKRSEGELICISRDSI